MKMMLQIAWRNLMRNKRRTFLSALTIAVGMMYFAMMDSLMSGMDKQAVDNMVNLSTGAVKIQSREYESEQETFPLEFGIESEDEIIELLKGDSRVKGISPRTIFLGQVTNYEDMVPVRGIVVDQERDTLVYSLMEHIEGAYFSEGHYNSANEIILGSSLAEDLGLELDSYITLYGQTKYEAENADAFVVVGIINSPDPTINSNTVFITESAGEEFLDLEGLQSEINISLHDRNNFNEMLDDMVEIQATLQAALHSDTVLTFRETGADFMKMMESKSGFGYMMLSVILFIAAVGIFNTVLMSVYERIREIGVLRAHGMHPKDLTKLFMFEGLFTGILGSVLGFFLAVSATYYFVEFGLDYSAFASDMDLSSMPIGMTEMYGVWNIPQIIGAGIFSTIIATIAAIIPAKKAGNLSVTDALRHN